MNYIIFDLEWNQSSAGGEEAVSRLPFEIVEIGAVKYNSRMEEVSRFCELIRPQVYLEMHRVTGQLIHLNMEELLKGDTFPQVMERFLAWCGESAGNLRASKAWEAEYRFCTWGTQDLTELQRNMKYFGMEPLAEGPIPFLDAQKLFSIAFEDCKSRKSLEYAVDFLHIPKDIPFHRAFSDAYYTGKVLAMCNFAEVLKNVSFDVFHPPAKREDEVKVQFDTYMKYISREFADKEEAFQDREVISSKCYLCHCNLKKKLKWFTANGRHYYCVAYCEKHGYLKGKIRVRKTDDDKVYIVKTTKFISREEAEDILKRKEHAREIRKRHRLAASHKKGSSQ